VYRNNVNPKVIGLVVPLLAVSVAGAQVKGYRKIEYRIPMRDGKKMYCAVYVPVGRSGKHPIMLERTPYSAGPYGPNKMTGGLPGSKKFQDANYIFAFSDVRGRFMSEGKWAEIRPILATHKTKSDVDETTDAYDTVDYLIKHVPGNNGRVGVWGISYPGFYASASAINNHPAVKAVSPQAPVSEWFLGDDVYHNGAFFLQDNFEFYFFFGQEQPKPVEEYPSIGDNPRKGDAYKYYLGFGSASNAEKFYKGRIPFWGKIMNHDRYDGYWQNRSVPPRMKNVKCPTLVVGGWFDAEDLYGTLNTYQGIERLNPGGPHWLVMGPWSHGMWAGGGGDSFGGLSFGQPTSDVFQNQIEFPFFDAYLRGPGGLKRPEAQVFETGTNRWRTFEQWPPAIATPYTVYLAGPGHLDTVPGPSGKETYISDPANPVPYQDGVLGGRSATYMVDDQRFASKRSDVLTYQTDELEKDLTVAGRINVDLNVTTTSTDADFIVKVIDVYPSDAGDLADRQVLVRGDVMRGKFRNGFSTPAPFVPGKPAHVPIVLNDVLHTFKKGHRLMIQVQSSWFPLVDRNSQTYGNNFYAKPADYKKATIGILHSSKVTFKKL